MLAEDPDVALLRRSRRPEAAPAPVDEPVLQHVRELRHEFTAPTSRETRDMARAFRAIGYRVTIGSPQTLTEPWLVTVWELVDDDLPASVLHDAITQVRQLAEENGGTHVRSVADEAAD